MVQLLINKEYEKIVPELPKADYDLLVQSIKNSGLWLPIIVNAENVVLDGHHRYKACIGLGIPIKISVRTFESKLLEKKFVIECNLKRRHLNDFQKAELGIPLQKINQELSRVNQGTRTDLTSLSNEKKVAPFHSGKETAKEIGVSASTFERAKKILLESPEDVKEKLRVGKDGTSISKEYKTLVKTQKREKHQEAIKKIQVNLPDTVTLYNQDFKTAPVPDNSVSLIMTDPPYHEKYLPLFGDLSKHAARVLRDGGSLITYAGHFNIGKVINMMESQGLKFHWIISVVHSGPSASVFGRKILVGWKPMLWFTKGDYKGPFVRDLIKSEFQGKELHEWAQSTVEADYYIKHITIENDIVYDPFLGQGTFGISAVKQNRQFIGCEIDKDHFENARRLISDAT